MKHFLFITLSILLISCDGTLGGFDNRVFQSPKENIITALDTFFIDNPEMQIPAKWKSHDNWKKRGYDFLDSRIFYFNTVPEEMYYVTFVANGNENQNKNGPTILAIRAVNNGRGKWIKYDDFDAEEKERIEQRFDKNVIIEIEKYSRIKAVRKR